MSSYGYYDKYKTVAWTALGRLESDYGDYEHHDINVLKNTPIITYGTGGEEYYPQVCCSYNEEQYSIDFSGRAIQLSINDHYKKPDCDENGEYKLADLEDETTITLVQVDKKEGTIKKYKVELEEEKIVTDYREKIKYNIPVTVDEGILYYTHKDKGVNYICGYYNDLNQFIPINHFGFTSSTSLKSIEEDFKITYPDCRYVVIIKDDDTFDSVHSRLIEAGYCQKPTFQNNNLDDNVDDNLPF